MKKLGFNFYTDLNKAYNSKSWNPACPLHSLKLVLEKIQQARETKMEHSEINHMITFHDYDQLRVLTDSELVPFLIAQLNSYAQNLDILDVDLLLSFGMTLAATTHHNLDETVLNWLTSNPNSEQLEIAIIFLRGLWSNKDSARSSTFLANVNLLLKVHDKLQYEETTQYEFVLILCELLKSNLPQFLQSHINQILKKIYQNGFHDKQFDRLSKLVIHQALTH